MNGHAMYTSIQHQSSDDLLLQHAPLVKKIAYHLHARLPDNVQVDDLIQAGMMGLLEAINQFDAIHGASLETYAGIRIRGAMLDEVRSNDWTPRSVSRNLREMAAAISKVEARNSGPAKESEIAKELGVSLEKYQKMSREASMARMFSFEELDGGDDGPSFDAVDSADGPSELFQDQDFRDSLAGTIQNLPEREQLVMSLYYEEELNLREIGEVLDVSESRVSQIHGQAMARIRAGMQEWTANI
ncbi:MAG TPA: RNA polymerase sigma factor FliA [Chromatiales bacterium]|nr:RNA polymerase sigma factor FliA [Thiotrichales bacterium]HIP68518.1 RNA polymerase sigma factor FliA [Chromatiales bacterium]